MVLCGFDEIYNRVSFEQTSMKFKNWHSSDKRHDNHHCKHIHDIKKERVQIALPPTIRPLIYALFLSAKYSHRVRFFLFPKLFPPQSEKTSTDYRMTVSISRSMTNSSFFVSSVFHFSSLDRLKVLRTDLIDRDSAKYKETVHIH